ncbi:hypothetical protein BAUCODRAFT_551835 [Baudoinia panamericana UAMH 10762]|uniref:Uncharacterized protein n=1 Tax=Baudoinia panamericana (strain UAMH 10762) TaxID=717646 RepID=M2MST1_BAUPA|nr:uncharacterized protein BAUCODRAFT_551835 [Baudoinia panamericana UAMH 10762]EMC94558.1 hypothetical protein BAUCODRAFT_551835 [Baudoinia panamericana UAMH 10762]
MASRPLDSVLASEQPVQHADKTARYREEIEARTLAGESCKQISDALLARGIVLSDKTISRRRIEWGFRQRAENKMKGRSAPRPGKSHSARWRERSERTKQILMQLTAEGKPAEQIAEHCESQGIVFKAGVRTVWRLQAHYGLIPYDEDRAKARGAYRKQAVNHPKPLRQKKSMANVLENGQRSETLHYPSNCSFGPKRGVTGRQPSAQSNLDMSDDVVQIDSDIPDAEPLDTRWGDEMQFTSAADEFNASHNISEPIPGQAPRPRPAVLFQRIRRTAR